MINVKNLKFTYAGSERPAVDGIGFEVDAGEIFGFLGPSGAGKSTTQKVLTHQLKGFGGSVAVFGKDLRSWDSTYFEHIGVGFELPNHYKKLSALENLQFFSALYAKQTEDPMVLLKAVGLGEDVNKRVGDYSKGMQMRLNFARALLNRPKILFLDEPTAGLDPVNARRIKDLIVERQRAGCAIFLTTHNMSVAEELCNRVALIVEGRIAIEGSPRDLKVQHGKRAVQVEYREGNRLVPAEFPLEGLADNEEFRKTLREKPVETIHTKEATLEDIFIRVTGRSLS